MGSRSRLAFLGIGGLLSALAWWLWMPGASDASAMLPRIQGVQAKPPAVELLGEASPSSVLAASSRQPIKVDAIAGPTESSSRFSHPEWVPFERLMRGRILRTANSGIEETEPQPLLNYEVEFLVAKRLQAPEHFHRLQTDAEGYFTLDLRPLRRSISSISEAGTAGWYLWPRSADRSMRASSLKLLEWLAKPVGETELVDFVLEDSGVLDISGRVLDHAGNPCTSVQVFLGGLGDTDGVPVNSEGTFSITTNIPFDPDERFLEANNGSAFLGIFDRLGPRYGERLNAHAWTSQHVDLGDFYVRERDFGGSFINGRAFSEDGTPLPNWPLWTIMGSGFQKRTRVFYTDDAGYYSIAAQAGKATSLKLSQCNQDVNGATTPPESNLVLQSKEPTVILSCVDPWGDPVSLNRYTSIRSTDPGPDPVEGQAIEHDGRLFATVPSPGEYQVRILWMGLHGNWQIDQRFEVVPGHQEIVLHAEYVPRPTPAPDNGTSSGPSTPRIR